LRQFFGARVGLKIWREHQMLRRFPLSAAFSVVVASFLGATANAADLPSVVVTVKPIHALVAGIMTGVGEPTLVVDGSASPHTFTLRPSVARAINSADVFIRVSEQLEPFTRKVTEALPKSVTLITLADQTTGVKLLQQRINGTFEPHEHEEHDDHAGHDHEAQHDAHIWLDPTNAKVIVDVVSKALAAKYPAHAAVFQTNAATLTAKIDALTLEIEKDLAPVKDKPFIVFHDAYQYFEKRFSLAAAGSVTLSPDQQPSAKRLTAVRKKIGELGAVCVFAEPGFQPNLITAVTEGTKARAGMLDPEGITLTPGPDLYFELMRGLAKSALDCLSQP
jgi:zinc transport system substrate-binding protein